MFHTHLKELRAERRLTQSQLAQKIGVSPGNVGDWETGKSKPGYAALVALARTLEVSADELLGLECPGPAGGGGGLSEKEKQLITSFRRLPEEYQREILEFAHFQCWLHLEKDSHSPQEEGGALNFPGEEGKPGLGGEKGGRSPLRRPKSMV